MTTRTASSALGISMPRSAAPAPSPSQVSITALVLGCSAEQGMTCPVSRHGDFSGWSCPLDCTCSSGPYNARTCPCSGVSRRLMPPRDTGRGVQGALRRVPPRHDCSRFPRNPKREDLCYRGLRVNCAPCKEFPLPRGKGSQNDPVQCDLLSPAWLV